MITTTLTHTNSIPTFRASTALTTTHRRTSTPERRTENGERSLRLQRAIVSDSRGGKPSREPKIYE